MIPKEEWGEGPWQDEPDHDTWTDVTGLQCLAVRHDRMGHWCGYVGLPKGHPDYGKGYDDIYAEVHGGLTYARAMNPASGAEDGKWWIGFDCIHAGDLAPASRAVLRSTGRGKELAESMGNYETYRTLDYVRGQLIDLCDQLEIKTAMADPIAFA